jgi:hypothetical protein
MTIWIGTGYVNQYNSAKQSRKRTRQTLVSRKRKLSSHNWTRNSFKHNIHCDPRWSPVLWLVSMCFCVIFSKFGCALLCGHKLSWYKENKRSTRGAQSSVHVWEDSKTIMVLSFIGNVFLFFCSQINMRGWLILRCMACRRGIAKYLLIPKHATDIQIVFF